MSKKIILHIGTEKTATTTLQEFCNLNREKLRNNRILYPKCAGIDNHVRFSGAFLPQSLKRDFCNKINKEEFFKDFSQEIEHSACDTIIISNEHLSSRFDTQYIKRLSDYLVDDLKLDVEVLLYLRRQDDFFVSTYSTAVKGGHCLKIDYNDAISNSFRYNYYQLLERWSTYFPDIKVRVFERESLYEGNILNDFCFSTGINLDSNYIKPVPQNVSLSPEMLEFKRIANNFIWKKNLTYEKASLFSRKLTKKLTKLKPIYKGFDIISLKERKRIVQFYAESNRKLVNKYFNDRDKLFTKQVTSNGELFDKNLEQDFVLIALSLMNSEIDFGL